MHIQLIGCQHLSIAIDISTYSVYKHFSALVWEIDTIDVNGQFKIKWMKIKIIKKEIEEFQVNDTFLQ